MDRQPRDLPRFAQDLGDQFVTILQAVFPLGAKISRDAAEVSEFHFNVNWRAHEPTHLRRIVLILSTTLLEEYQNREHRPTIERWVIAYVNQGQQPQRLGIMIGVAVRCLQSVMDEAQRIPCLPRAVISASPELI